MVLSLGQVSLDTSQSGANLSSGRGGQGPGTTGHLDSALLAVPDASGLALDNVLAAKTAFVLGVLGDFNLPNHLSVRRTITSAVLANNANLLSAFSL